jgi:hypothetical protein
MEELTKLEESACSLDVKGGPENQHGKVSILFLFPR